MDPCSTCNQPSMRTPARRVRGVTVAILGLGAAGCDPVVNIAGAFFPGWLAATVIGAGLTVAIRYLFLITRLEPHLGSRPLVYTSLAVLLVVVTWLVLYRS
jgi:hypothetical protein